MTSKSSSCASTSDSSIKMDGTRGVTSRGVDLNIYETKSELKGMVAEYGEGKIGEWLKTLKTTPEGKTLVTILDVTKLAMMIVESISKASVKDLSGKEKYNMAKKLVPEIILFLRERALVDREVLDKITNVLKTGDEIISAFIPIVADIAKHPEVIQAGKKLVSTWKACCGCK